MVEVKQTEFFRRWFDGLRDSQAQKRILTRIRRLSQGNPGDVKPVGEGVSELRVDHGPGNRLYFLRRGSAVVILLMGGDKRTQGRDIKAAIAMADEIRSMP